MFLKNNLDGLVKNHKKCTEVFINRNTKEKSVQISIEACIED